MVEVVPLFSAIKKTIMLNLPVPYKPDEGQKLFKQGLIKEITLGSAGGSKAYGWIFNANPGDVKKSSMANRQIR